MDKKVMANQVSVLFTFFGFDISAAHLEIYYEVLRDFDEDALKAAVKGIIKSERTLPRNPLPLIIDYINPPLDEGDSESIIRQISEIMVYEGRYRSPNLSPLLSQIVEDCGGWISVCTMSEEDFRWRVRNLFKGGYRGDGRMYPQKGLSEIQNRRQIGAKNDATSLGKIIQQNEMN